MRFGMNSRNTQVLSLRNWPLLRAKSSEIKLSPETSKIIQSSGILVQQIAPKSFQDFINDNKLHRKPSQEVIKMYKQFTERQNKKIALLKLVKENNLNIEKKQSESQFIQSEYLGISKNSTKDSHKLTPFKKKKSKKNIIVSLSKSKEKNGIKVSKNKEKTKQLSSRLDYYGNSSDSIDKQKNIPNKCNIVNNNGNSKSEIKLIKKFSFPHDDYNDMDSVKPPMSDIKQKQVGKGQFYKQMTSYANRVMQMSTKQNQQLRDSKDLNDKQRNRLRKIHQVQKQRLHQQMNKMVKSLSRQKISKNFDY